MLNALLNLVFPQICFVCGNSLHTSEKQLCFSCLRNLPISGFPPSAKHPTAKIFAARRNILWGYSFLNFERNNAAQHILHALKYQNAKKMLPEILKPLNLRGVIAAYDPIDAIVPVPLHPKKLALRGYNQAEEIAQVIGDIIQKPVETNWLKRVHYNKTQTKKSRAERHQSTKPLFEAKNFSAQHVLLVDDVVTTGATLHKLMDACHSVTNFSVFTLARA